MSLDPVGLQVLLGALRSACEEMNAILVRAAHSANIKERRDCSTALFDAAGEMVMQAEAIPVHLGSMPDAVAAILGEELEEGVSWILNDPFRGGTHLPDITLVSPIFREGSLLGFAAARAHHADVGGEAPGSMPSDSRSLSEEGLVIPPTRVGDGTLEELASRMRGTAERLADLRAQEAANRTGARRLGELAGRMGTGNLRSAMADVLDHAERRTCEALAELPEGAFEAEDVLEDDGGGSESDVTLRVRVTIRDGSLEADFSGSGDQVAGNLNCPLSVTRSAVYYAVRTIADPDAPPSAGAYRPISVAAPEGSIVNARPPAAVAAGNVETSSRIADLVISALGEAVPVPAQGQGTMNNVTLSGEEFTYYETLGGGQGACPGADGPSAVHVAMSNTLNTPIEAFESELPLRIRRLELRRGSGGAGAHRGGDGLVREIEALDDIAFTLITERRRHAPKGRDGGGDGDPGRNLLNGRPLPSKASGRLAPGDVLRIETPGGGGHGSADG